MILKQDEREITTIDLYFEDGQCVTLDKLIGYDVDLCKRENSCIEITCAFNNSELFSRFCNNTDNITKIYFRMKSIENRNDRYVVVMLCDMYIKNLVFNGSVDAASEMCIRFEGMVK